jgi:hypothetical protein
MRTRIILAAALVSALAFTTAPAADLTPAETKAIAKDAYVYGYPVVDLYRLEYDYFTDTGNPNYKGPWGQIHNIPRVYTPADTAFVSPNSDTPYSWLGLDLRAEPYVITVPPIERSAIFASSSWMPTRTTLTT